jgi:hypothetical protein
MISITEGDANGLTVAEDIEASPHLGESGKPDRNHSLGQEFLYLYPFPGNRCLKSGFLSL